MVEMRCRPKILKRKENGRKILMVIVAKTLKELWNSLNLWYSYDLSESACTFRRIFQGMNSLPAEDPHFSLTKWWPIVPFCWKSDLAAKLTKQVRTVVLCKRHLLTTVSSFSSSASDSFVERRARPRAPRRMSRLELQARPRQKTIGQGRRGAQSLQPLTYLPLTSVGTGSSVDFLKRRKATATLPRSGLARACFKQPAMRPFKHFPDCDC